jgi:hypothetical protein
MESGTDELLTDVWAAAPNDVIAVGSGEILRYNGEEWISESDGDTGGLWGVWGASSDNPHYIGTGGFRGIWGSSAEDVFVVGINGRIFHFDGVEWSLMESGTESYLFSVWGTSSSDVYAAGIDGTMLHFDGNAWRPLESGTDSQLWSIWGISSGDIFVGSRCGIVLQGIRGAQE